MQNQIGMHQICIHFQHIVISEDNKLAMGYFLGSLTANKRSIRKSIWLEYQSDFGVHFKHAVIIHPNNGMATYFQMPLTSSQRLDWWCW